MSFINSNFIRESENLLTPTMIAHKFNRNPLRPQVLSRVFSEDFENVKRKIIVDPRGKFVRCWSNIFLVACLANLFFDPLFLLIPKIQPDQLCLETRVSSLGVVLTCIRSLTDLFFAFNILVRFRTAYVAPSSRVFGRGELVVDPRKIALRYIRTGFWFDLIVAMPFPQVLIWCILPNLKGSATSNFQTSLRFVMLIQYFLRLSIAYPLSIRIAKATGIVYEAAWLGAAYNLVLYLLSSHVMGNCYYLLVVQRVAACWRSVCDAGSNSSCNYKFFDCNAIGDYPSRDNWIQASNLTTTCNPNNGNYPFGIYTFGVAREVYAAGFLQTYFYSLWFGLRSVSTQGQNLVTSIYIGENIYSTVIVMLGMLNMALLLGNLQMYTQSIAANLEEWRLKKCDKEQWMHHRQLPETLIQSVHRYDRYKWVATAGVNEEALLNDLPKGLRKQIKRHLCLNLVRQVPLFGEMDERTLDSICERLKPMLWTDDLFIIREGDPLCEILFIIRGYVDSYTTNGGHAGFFNTCQLGPGDFCGEELLTWALKSKPNRTLPASTRTVKAISEVEAFALGAEDLRFFATQFQTLHSKQLRHTLRFYSQQWRTWAACFIQVRWRQYKRRKQARELGGSEDSSECLRATEMNQVMVLQPGAGLGEYVAMLMTNIKATGRGLN